VVVTVAGGRRNGRGRRARPPRHGRPLGRRARRPGETQLAQRTLSRYFALIDAGRGADFCSTAITSATLAAGGGVYRCAAKIDAYVRRIHRTTFPAAVLDLEALFYEVDDGSESHCTPGGACPRSRYVVWAREAADTGVSWKAGSDPHLARSVDGRVVAVVDPARSSPSWITLYYQAPDGRILRASWSTARGSWRGSVVDTHAGWPFISHVRVLATRRLPDGSLSAFASARIGTADPVLERFRLVREGGRLRADTWVNVTDAFTD
jgi:hypothetical protein